MSGGRLPKTRRSSAGVSPVRIPTVTSRVAASNLRADIAMPASGERRFLFTSWTSALSGETYKTRSRRCGSSGSGSAISPAVHPTKAPSVLPEPVGAQMSACSPAAIAGQPSACAAVGSAKDEPNQLRVGSLKEARGSGRRAGTAPSIERLFAAQRLAPGLPVDLSEEIGKRLVELGRALERDHVRDVGIDLRSRAVDLGRELLAGDDRAADVEHAPRDERGYGDLREPLCRRRLEALGHIVLLLCAIVVEIPLDHLAAHFRINAGRRLARSVGPLLRPHLDDRLVLFRLVQPLRVLLELDRARVIGRVEAAQSGGN